MEDCLTPLLARSSSCTTTAATCGALARLYGSYANTRYRLCKTALREASGSCSPWDNVQKTQEIMSAGVMCVAQFGRSENASACVGKIMGEDDGCICEVLDHLIPSCKRKPGKGGAQQSHDYF